MLPSDSRPPENGPATPASRSLIGDIPMKAIHLICHSTTFGWRDLIAVEEEHPGIYIAGRAATSLSAHSESPDRLDAIGGRDSPWVDVLFAAEGMSHSARGLSYSDTKTWPRVIRDAYTKLAAGHVSLDLSETGGICRYRTRQTNSLAKIARVAYWYRRLRDARQRVLDAIGHVPGVQIDPDAEHPRILAAVNEIESGPARMRRFSCSEFSSARSGCSRTCSTCAMR